MKWEALCYFIVINDFDENGLITISINIYMTITARPGEKEEGREWKGEAKVAAAEPTTTGHNGFYYWNVHKMTNYIYIAMVATVVVLCVRQSVARINKTINRVSVD